MQEQGVRHDDPEYLKAHNLLSAVQRQQAYQKQRQMQMLHAQRQQQQPQPPQQVPQAAPQAPQQLQGPLNGIAESNGTDGKTLIFSSSFLFSIFHFLPICHIHFGFCANVGTTRC